MSNRFPTLSGLWQLPLVGRRAMGGMCGSGAVRRTAGHADVDAVGLRGRHPHAAALSPGHRRCRGRRRRCRGGGRGIGGLAVFLAGRERPLQWRLLAQRATSAFSVVAALSPSVAASRTREPESLLILVSAVRGRFTGLRLSGALRNPPERRGCAEERDAPRRSAASMRCWVAAAAIVSDAQPALQAGRGLNRLMPRRTGLPGWVGRSGTVFHSSGDTWGSAPRSRGTWFRRYPGFLRRRWTSSPPTISRP